MTYRTTTADQVEVGDVLSDDDHVEWYVDDVEHVENVKGASALRFLLRSVDDGRTEGQIEHVYEASEEVTLSNEDQEGEPFESALWRATAPNPGWDAGYTERDYVRHTYSPRPDRS
jgi:hypothetical protein